MTETAQIVIVSVITVLTIVLSLVGIQLVFVLKDLRITIFKANEILTDTQNITGKLSRSTDSVSGALVGLKAAIALLGAFKGGKK